jgi:iron complex transport system ATP-binding protein
MEGLTFAYGSEPVLSRIDLQLGSAITALVGPNAVGKSTLLRCVAGILKPQGRIVLDGQDLSALGKRQRAQLIGYLAQDGPRSVELTVLEAVLLGRFHTLSWRVSDADLDMALAVLHDLGIANLALRSVRELSGGQQQMVSIAQVLVQRPRVLLMDEPTNSLDLQHQLEIAALIEAMTLEKGLVTILVLHDLNLAARVANTIVVLHKGQVYACGEPVSVVTPEMLRIVYGVRARVNVDEEGLPVITLLDSIRSRRSRDRLSQGASAGLTSASES